MRSEAATLGVVMLLAAVLLAVPGGPVDAGAAQAAESGDAKSGAKLFKRYCRGCHGKDGRGGGHTFMPHIHNLTKKGYIDLLPDERLAAVIREGGVAFGMSSYMPAWGKKLNDGEIADLVAHIRTLPLY